MLTLCVWIVWFSEAFWGGIAEKIFVAVFVGGILGASLWQLFVGVLFCEGGYLKAGPNILSALNMVA